MRMGWSSAQKAGSNKLLEIALFTFNVYIQNCAHTAMDDWMCMQHRDRPGGTRLEQRQQLSLHIGPVTVNQMSWDLGLACPTCIFRLGSGIKSARAKRDEPSHTCAGGMPWHLTMQRCRLHNTCSTLMEFSRELCLPFQSRTTCAPQSYGPSFRMTSATSPDPAVQVVEQVALNPRKVNL